MMKKLLPCLVLLLMSALRVGAEPDAVKVFAAASLSGVLGDITNTYDAPVSLSYGGSGMLARQVQNGAPADLVILASPDWAEWLRNTLEREPSDVTPIAANSLVLIAAKGTAPIKNIADLPAQLGADRLAMGQRDAVPAGQYARQWLDHAGLWGQLQSQLAETSNVRAALALVAQNQAPYGIVYATDAASEPAVQIIMTAPDNAHAPIGYHALALTPQGQDFLDHLQQPQPTAIILAAGFLPVPE